MTDNLLHTGNISKPDWPYSGTVTKLCKLYCIAHNQLTVHPAFGSLKPTLVILVINPLTAHPAFGGH